MAKQVSTAPALGAPHIATSETQRVVGPIVVGTVDPE